MTELTDKDRDFFEKLANRPADHAIEEDDVVSTNIDVTNDIESKFETELIMPDWYKPWMKTKVGWLNRMPQRPLTKADRRRGRWVDVSL